MASKKTSKTTTKRSTTKRGPYVLAVTQCRPWSIVAGHVEARNADGTIVLADARMIVYFSSDARGLYGVAANGPGSAARVSPRVVRACVRPLEHEIACSDAAKRAIEASPWH